MKCSFINRTAQFCHLVLSILWLSFQQILSLLAQVPRTGAAFAFINPHRKTYDSAIRHDGWDDHQKINNFHQALFPNHRKKWSSVGFPNTRKLQWFDRATGCVMRRCACKCPWTCGHWQRATAQTSSHPDGQWQLLQKSILQSYSEIVATCCHMLKWRKSKELTGNSEDARSNGWAIFQEACDAW